MQIGCPFQNEAIFDEGHLGIIAPVSKTRFRIEGVWDLALRVVY